MSSTVRNIYVQLLPIVRPRLGQLTLPDGDGEHRGKILLCKWVQGVFKHRYTGMIKLAEFTPMERSFPDFRSKLEEVAKSLMPPDLPIKLRSLDLVAILEFPDPPECDEYVYIATLDGESYDVNDNANKDQRLKFDKNPCHWFDWDKIPFQDMPKDDAIWYPKVLWEGKLLKGSFTFGSWAEKTLKSYQLSVVERL